jgi:hypothetical protein
MGSFEENYSEDVLRTFTEEERAQLRKLHQQLDDKFDEIVSLLAEQLDYSTADPRCYEEAENVIDRWEEDAETAADTIEPTNSLQGLPRQHHDIAEEILGIRDLAFQRNQEGPVPEEVIELMRTREVIFAVWPDPNMPFGQDSEILKGGKLVADLSGDPRTDDVVVTSPDGRLVTSMTIRCRNRDHAEMLRRQIEERKPVRWWRRR